MRKLHIIIMVISCLLLTTCVKDKEITPLEINVGVLESTYDYVLIGGEYSYETELLDFYLLYDENPDFSSAESVKMNVDGKGIDAEIRDLQSETTYYYCVECKTKYSFMRTDVVTFETEKVNNPTVMTNDVTNITATSATCGGEVTSDGGAEVTSRGICWSTSQNPTISNSHTTDGAGTGSYSSNLTNLTPNTTYYVRAYATNSAGTGYGDVVSFTTLEEENGGIINGHEYVDLGLPSGLKWATCNVGASSPEDYGNYYAWGETTTKAEYTSGNSLTDDLSISDLQSQGIIDGDHNLTPSHDAATANWGGTWRLPTKAELQELLNNCTWEWTALNGVNGRKVTGPNGNHIFLPAAGFRNGSALIYAGEYGLYWSSTPYESDSNSAYYLYFNSSSQSVNWDYRGSGRSVRPVAE